MLLLFFLLLVAVKLPADLELLTVGVVVAVVCLTKLHVVVAAVVFIAVVC